MIKWRSVCVTQVVKLQYLTLGTPLTPLQLLSRREGLSVPRQINELHLLLLRLQLSPALSAAEEGKYIKYSWMVVVLGGIPSSPLLTGS